MEPFPSHNRVMPSFPQPHIPRAAQNSPISENASATRMPLIQGTNIEKSFKSGKITTHVLKGISLTIRNGEFVAIMGKSGAGKSTLLYQLSGLDQPTQGIITIEGADITKFSERSLSVFRLHTLGFVFQDYALIPELNARENVLLPLLMRGMEWSSAERTSDESLDSVGLSGRYEHLPSELSGGEQQRVSIARAIAGNPKILFADEPTANLDSISGKAVIDLLTKLNDEGQTIVMVTHEEEYTKHCDRILVMEDGRIIDERELRQH